jgi:DNA-binding response OmpR family regulator
MIEGPILIVDDDPLLYEAIAVALELNGYQIRLACGGREGLAAIAAECPAMVLLDLNMPGLDGEGVLRELAARGIQIPVVLMSADERAEEVARRYGVAGYLKKPFAIPRLLAAVAACGASARASQQRDSAA